MICTAFAKTEVFSEDFPALPLRGEVLEHISSAKNEGLKNERIAAYSLLSLVTKKIFGKEPRIIWSENGKPAYENERIYFNLSHTAGLVAVCISDERCVGVDVEGEIPPERADRLEARFFSGLTFSDSQLSVKYLYADACDGEITFFDLSEMDGRLLCPEKNITLSAVYHSDSFSARWTLYEATMKSGGGGFTSLPCLDMLLLDTLADIKKININSTVYYLATAASK